MRIYGFRARIKLKADEGKQFDEGSLIHKQTK
jgi:hypothetical protein